MAKPIALAADHGGFELKEAVKAHLDELGLEYIDFGTHSTASVDYPDMALPACDAVVSGQCDKALLFCGTGVGISMAANKVKGIRACCCSDSFSCEYTRRHNDANALCMGGRVVGPGLACQLVDLFLNTPLRRPPRKAHYKTDGNRNPINIKGACIMTPMIVEHPLLQHKLSILRNKQTGTKEFRDLVGEIATLLCYEATRDLPMEEVEIETPITMAKTKVLAGRKLALVPILRAGMGMLDGMLTLLPAAKVGFIGLYRNEETLQPVEYFCKLPQDIAERDVLVLDPMLATGGSAIDAITQIKKHGAKRIKFIGLIAAPEGIEALHKAHPDVDIYLGAKDDHLNENGYIVPGLGDAGDRIYGTK